MDKLIMKKIIQKIIRPFSSEENLARQEYILNLILLTTIILIGTGFLISCIKLFFANSISYTQNSLSLILSGKISFFTTILCSATFIFINYLHTKQIIIVDRRMKRALARAYKSERELKDERDNLEIKVAEKTKELKIIQAEEIAGVYRFAEFGKLSSGLFHDLINPLTTVILNVGKIKEDHLNNCDLKNIGHDLDQTLKASNKMGDFINSVRKQIKASGQKELFCLNQEIEEALAVLNYKAMHGKVVLLLTAPEKITMTGDPIKFNQIVTNLTSNSIDAYQSASKEPQEVLINLQQKNGFIILSVKDFGPGISFNNITKIFEPFFSTKTDRGSLGLGLSLIKNLIEKDFNGEISVISVLGEGSEFIVKIPLPNNYEQEIKTASNLP